MSVLNYFAAQEKFNAEALIFQLIMSGLDEGIVFRGILSRLLFTVLPEKQLILIIFPFFNRYSIWISSRFHLE